MLSPQVQTYEELILDSRSPASVVIIGAGPIGMEFAYVLNAYGAEVTVLEVADRLLPREDRDVSHEIAKEYRKLGINCITSARVDTIDAADPSATVHWTDSAGQSHALSAEKVLIAIGFEPNTDRLGLEHAGVEVDSREAIVIDERMRTSVDHIFAIGDVTMKFQLAHVAEAMGIVAAETIADAPTMELGDYRMMPRATFCRPQVASFGLTEEEARTEHADVRIARFPFAANGKAHSVGNPTGFVKLVTDRNGALLGGHVVGDDAAELLPELTLAQKWDLGTFELSRNVHIHPTLGESVNEAVRGFEGGMINL